MSVRERLSRSHREEEQAEQGRSWVEDPRPLAVRGPRQEDTWTARARAITGFSEAIVVDMFLSHGPWLSFADGACCFDARQSTGHASSSAVRAYFQGLDRSPRRRRKLSKEKRELLEQASVALCGRFDALADAHIEARSLHLTMRSTSAADAVDNAARALGLWLDRPEASRLAFTAPSMASVRAVGRGLDVLRLALKSHEAGEPAVMEQASARETKTRQTRVRVVEVDQAESMLAAIVALEASIYEPARRDPPEKLRVAFDDPAGVAVVAEARTHDGDEWSLVGFSLGGPLELFDIDGPPDDPRHGAHDTLYVISTTIDPSLQGYGLGFRLKQALCRGARDQQRDDGSPRYDQVVGRSRVGMTGAMQRVNARLGAHTVCVLDNQYGGDGQALYYEMPLRAPTPHVPAQGGRAHLGASCRPYTQDPPDLAQAYESGALYSAFVAPAAGPELVSKAVVRAAEYISQSVPWLAGLHMVASDTAAMEVMKELLAQTRPNAHTVLAWLGAPSDLSGAVQRPLDELRATIEEQGAETISAIVFEGVQEATGHPLDDQALDELRRLRSDYGLPLVALEHASAFSRGPRLSDAITPDVLIWRGGAGGKGRGGRGTRESPDRPKHGIAASGERRTGVVFVHADPALQPTRVARAHPPDEVSLIRAHHWLREAHAHPPTWERLHHALSSLPTRGAGGFRVWRGGPDEANELADRLERSGYAPRRLVDGLAFAPPFDLSKEDYDEVERLIRQGF